MKTSVACATSLDSAAHRIHCSRLLSMVLMAIGICLVTALSALAQAADRPELPKSIAKNLQKMAGNHGAFQSQLATIISKLESESFKQVEEQIEAFGQTNNVSSFRTAFYTAWKNDVSRGSIPAP